MKYPRSVSFGTVLSLISFRWKSRSGRMMKIIVAAMLIRKSAKRVKIAMLLYPAP